MKEFIKSVLLFIVPFVLIILINFTIDNAYIFRSEKTYDKIGKLIAEGNNISNLYNYNEFLTRKYAIEYMEESPEIICLGSSRIMQINNSIFDKKFFNMGVSAISLKEIIASYNVIYKKGFKPETIIIGIDPSIFLKSKSKLRDFFINDFNSFTATAKLKNSVEIRYSKNKYMELINPIYCFENLKYGRKDYTITKNIFIDEPVVCFDGSYVYNSRKRNLSQNEVLLEAKDQFNRFFYNRFNNMSIDADLQSLFENFIINLKQDHKIIFFLAPYHPFLAKKFELNELNGILKVEKYFKVFSINNNIELIGSFDPNNIKYMVNSNDFYDGIHIKREVAENMIKNHFGKNTIVSSY